MMQQQEKETELEQREDDLRVRAKRLSDAGGEPARDAAGKVVAPKKFDEFNE